MRRIAKLLTPVALLLALTAGDADALRCGKELVAVGDSKLEVLAKCGEPFWSDRHALAQSDRDETGGTRHTLVNIDEWTYNPGPHRLLHYLRFENGRLVAIDTGGYGFDPEAPATRDTCRGGKLLAVGDTAAEVLIKCGTPEVAEEWVDTETGSEAIDTVEEWSYNFGPHDPIYLLRLRNDRVVKIEKRTYGY